jgi:hypothetical protein
MAEQVGPNFFVGKLGNQIGYKRGNKYFVRTAPTKVNRSRATKKAALDFGLASKTGKLIRRALLDKLDIPFDGTVTNRLNKALAPVIKMDNPTTVLEGFNFNTHTPLENLLKESLQLKRNPDGSFLLKIPAQRFSKAKYTTHIEIKAIAVSINVAKQQHEAIGTEVCIIDLKKPFTGLELALPAAGKGTTMIVLQVRGLELVNGKYYDVQNRRYYAAEMIAVIPERILKPAGKNKIKELKKLLPQKAKAAKQQTAKKKAPPGR